MPVKAELRINTGMDLSSRLLWYMAWHPRPLYIIGTALALMGALTFHSLYGFLLGLLFLPLRWKATSLVNQETQRITEVARKSVASAGAERVGTDPEACDCKTVMMGTNGPSSPFGIRPKASYSLTAVYICDAYFAIYPGTSFSLPNLTLRFATTGDEVYFRHVSAINHGEGSIQISLTRGTKAKTIAISNNADGTALLQALRSKLREPK